MDDERKDGARALWVRREPVAPAAGEGALGLRAQLGRDVAGPCGLLVRLAQAGRRRPALEPVPVGRRPLLLWEEGHARRLPGRVARGGSLDRPGRRDDDGRRLVRVRPLLDQEHQDEARDERQADGARQVGRVVVVVVIIVVIVVVVPRCLKSADGERVGDRGRGDKQRHVEGAGRDADVGRGRGVRAAGSGDGERVARVTMARVRRRRGVQRRDASERGS